MALSIPAFKLLQAPLVRDLVPMLIRSKWETKNRIGDISLPILFISGLKDELVPPSHMRHLHDSAKAAAAAASASEAEGESDGAQERRATGAAGTTDRRTFVTIAEGTHNDTPNADTQKYFGAVAKFFVERANLVRTGGGCWVVGG